MWEMLDPDLECGNECGGPGPPPEFLVPPPPRPPFLAELVNCNEEQQQQQPPFGAASPFADVDMCEAFPIIDASYHSGPSFQTSAMIALCSVLLLLVIFISSLLVWKHKRKVQNFLPCKTPTRGPPHLDATGVSAAHSVTYEDPDVHLGHHPLVMRHHHHHHHHHNMELHAKQIHYPSGYPMPRSPPLFICSSPGPDPYRSHDNVYEELEHGHGRDTDSEPPIQSDDDFAEDELSLPGDRSFHKSPSDGGATTVATIYHDRSNGGGSSNSAVTTASTSTVPASEVHLVGAGSVGVGGTGPAGFLDRSRTERNSLLSSSSSSGNDHPLHPRHSASGGGGPAGGGGGGAGGGGPPHPGANGGSGGAGTNNNNNNNGSNNSNSSSSSASNSNRNSNSSTDCVSGHSGNNNTSNGNSNGNAGHSMTSNGGGNGGGVSNGNTTSSTATSTGGLGLFRSRKHHPAATLGGSGRRGARGGTAADVPRTAPCCDPLALDGATDPTGMLPPMYDERALMTLPPPAYNLHHLQQHPHQHHHHQHLPHQQQHLNGVNNNGGGPLRPGNYYSTIDGDELLDPVERRNRINAQLSASSGVVHHGPGGGVSTIFRNGSHRTLGYGAPPGACLSHANNNNHSHHPSSNRSRTNPRSSDRRGARNALQLAGSNGNDAGGHLAVISGPDPTQYIYHEPVFHEGLIYDGCLSHTYSDRSGGSGSTGTGSTGGVAYPYILPHQFTTFRNGGSGVGGGGGVGVGAGVGGGPPGPGQASLYSRDSSFGSDSGYSQHTQASSRSAGWGGPRRATGSSSSAMTLPSERMPPPVPGAKPTGPKTPSTEQQQQHQQQQAIPSQQQPMVDS